MSSKQKLVGILATAGFLGVVVLGFQNCSPARFTQESSNVVLKTEGASVSSINTPGDDGVIAGTPELGGPSDKQDTSGLVECQMLHPNKKIILASEFKVSPSNGSSTRVCMSKHACLEMINAYAIRHDCSLEMGPGADADADEGLQCTEIFPGSKGTCYNASIVSDSQVADILKHLVAK